MGQIKVEKCDIEGLYVITPAVHGDERGYFMETYNFNDMKEQGCSSWTSLSKTISTRKIS